MKELQDILPEPLTMPAHDSISKTQIDSTVIMAHVQHLSATSQPLADTTHPSPAQLSIGYRWRG